MRAGILVLLAPLREMPLLILILSTLAAMCLPLSAEVPEKGLTRAASLVMGIVYIFGSWKTAILLHDSAPEPAGFGASAGNHWLMFGLMVNWIGDTGATTSARISDGINWRQRSVRGRPGRAPRLRRLRVLCSD